MSASIAGTIGTRELDQLIGALRPKLHRYCARMTGSAIDGEDVVQEALVKALEALPASTPITHPEGWLFRIAHNAALDFLRRSARRNAVHADQDPDDVLDPVSAVSDRQVAATSLHTFMRLAVAQRSSVILMDVLGYSLQEIGAVMDCSIPAVKAALHRGRARLRLLAQEPDDQQPPTLAAAERALLAAYIDRFNARDFDAIRDMLADEVRLELVNRTRMNGRREVGNYVHNYAQATDWHLVPGLVDGRAAALVHDPRAPAAPPRYFILLTWTGDRIATIRDFRYAAYAADGAALTPST